MIASASRNLLSMTTSLPRSICWISPESRSPTADANSSRSWCARLRDALDDALLGRLDGGTPEDGEVEGLLHDVAGLEALVEDLRLLEGDLARRVLDRLDDGLEQHDADLTARVVDLDLGLDGGPYFFASAAMKPSCSSPYSSVRSSCFEFESSRNAANISAELTIQRPRGKGLAEIGSPYTLTC
jgi:hypothetical protein